MSVSVHPVAASAPGQAGTPPWVGGGLDAGKDPWSLVLLPAALQTGGVTPFSGKAAREVEGLV